MNLESIGFYTLSDDRVKQASEHSPLWRCELLVTKRCNFSCPYCRSVGPSEDLSWTDAKVILSKWFAQNLKNIRFSGGEPTLWEYLYNAVWLCKLNGVENIAISTNGSANLSVYKTLLEVGANDFSVSLDACCAEDNTKMTGRKKAFDNIVESIKFLSSKTYVTVGIVLTEDNESKVNEIVQFAKSLGVSDVRVIPAAQYGSVLPTIKTDGMPILEYRRKMAENGGTVRGLSPTDSRRCHLALDDMVVIGTDHYPCIIHAREGGQSIGSILDDFRQDRANWARNYDVFTDKICRENCLDVCREYNNKFSELS